MFCPLPQPIFLSSLISSPILSWTSPKPQTCIFLFYHIPPALTCLLFLSWNVDQHLHSLEITWALYCPRLCVPLGHCKPNPPRCSAQDMSERLLLVPQSWPISHWKPVWNRRAAFFTAVKATGESKAIYPDIKEVQQLENQAQTWPGPSLSHTNK